MKTPFLLVLLCLLLTQVNYTQVNRDSLAKNKQPNIILLIGDGMGLSQLSSAYYFGDDTPNFSRFTTVGLSITRSGSHKITDSAAGATALSCGKKTYNGAIGVDMDTTSVETILEYVEDKKWNTALISTSSITHATPASFFGHIYSRAEQQELAKQLCYSDVDFFAGGGIKYFTHRLDDKNFLDTLTAQGFEWDTTGLKKEVAPNKRYAFLLADGGLKQMDKGRGSILEDASMLALDYLSQKDQPFFCMIEGSQIDWGGHNNDANYLIEEVLDFDKTIGKVLDFAEKDGNTIVIVTADHETGGFTLAGKQKTGALNKQYDDYNTIDPKFSTGGHSSALVPVLAFGPGSSQFSGIYENTAIYFKMMRMIK
jgi:alkaline phosphatase